MFNYTKYIVSDKEKEIYFYDNLKHISFLHLKKRIQLENASSCILENFT